MENKINIAELLKDCPKGMELYSPLCGKCVFDRLNFGTIICKKQNTQEITFTSDGYYMLPVFDNCECMIFPSKDQRDWNKFHRPFKDGDIVALDTEKGVQVFIFEEYIKGEKDYAHCYLMLEDDGAVDLERGKYYVDRFATEEEKEKLFDAIKANGYRWNAETKTLEKLIEPKFKVGDKVRHKTTNKNYIFEISKVYDDSYGLVGFTWMIYMKYQDDYELVPNKFDIATLKPFESRVLVRNVDGDLWNPAIYGFPHSKGCYVVGGVYWEQCIPYEENKELLGTTNNPEEYGSR